jgi:hypothetical protein
MSIELTTDQADALAVETTLPVEVIDPRTRRTYRLVPEAEYATLAGRPYYASPWMSSETAALAAEAFGKLHDTDYDITCGPRHRVRN